jgi:cysteine desulfurase
MRKKIYLDYAATTPTNPAVLKAMEPFFCQKFGNPSSIHSFGQETKKAIEEAREKVAHLINALPEEIVFTSGGTEADNFAIKGTAYALKDFGNHIITTQIEHHAVLNPCKFLEKQGFKVTYLPVDKDGLINPDDVKKALTKQTILVSIMHANNEIGTIEPIAEIAKIIEEQSKILNLKSKIYFHTDAVQTVGHIPVDVKKLGVDLLSISAHKFYGPKGVGALYIRKGIKIEPLLHGGEQERKRRASTENVAGIVGFGKACELAEKEMEKEAKRLTELRDYFINQILTKIKKSRLNGHPTQRLPNNVNVSIEGIEGESMLISLDMAGIACSTGSACSSSSLEPSHVLLALGLSPEIAHSSLRFTLGRQTTKKDLDYTLQQLIKIVERLRQISPF